MSFDLQGRQGVQDIAREGSSRKGSAMKAPTLSKTARQWPVGAARSLPAAALSSTATTWSTSRSLRNPSRVRTCYVNVDNQPSGFRV